MTATNSIQSIMETTLETIKNSIDSNTIVGNPIKAESSVIVPISKVTVGFGIGGGEYNKNNKKDIKYDANFAGGSGGAITISPVAFVVVENGETRLISLEDNINLVDNILTVTPRIIDKVQKILKHDKNNDKNNDKDVKFQEDIDKKEASSKMQLKRIREQQGLSLRALSELAGVPQRTIEDLERRDDGRVSTMIKLTDALGVTLDELCRDEAAE